MGKFCSPPPSEIDRKNYDNHYYCIPFLTTSMDNKRIVNKLVDDVVLGNEIELTKDELDRLAKAPVLSQYQREKLDKDAKKNWDLFYKRNGDRFFKNRYWTRHEFHELFDSHEIDHEITTTLNLLEIGCGCGDFVFPLLQDDCLEQVDDNESDDNMKLKPRKFFLYCCDISEKAIEILKNNSIYLKNQDRIKAFVADITLQDDDNVMKGLDGKQMDFVTLVFVLSAVDPKKMKIALENIHRHLKPGGLVLFRDYAIYDKAMLRFNERSKICDQFYVRQDGTRAYFFDKHQLEQLFVSAGFRSLSVEYVRRETLNKATMDKFSRIFIQAKFMSNSGES